MEYFFYYCVHQRKAPLVIQYGNTKVHLMSTRAHFLLSKLAKPVLLLGSKSCERLTVYGLFFDYCVHQLKAPLAIQYENAKVHLMSTRAHFLAH